MGMNDEQLKLPPKPSQLFTNILQFFHGSNTLAEFFMRLSKIVISESVVSKRVTNSVKLSYNKAGYTATEVACGWAEAIFEVTRLFGQEQ